MSFMSFIVFIPLVCACKYLLCWLEALSTSYTEGEELKIGWAFMYGIHGVQYACTDMCQMCQLFEEIASGLIFHKLVSPSKQLKEMAWWRRV